MLADRVGIIDHGHIVAEGTPESLKAEIGRPSVEADAGRARGPRRGRRGAVAVRLASCPRRPGAAAVRLDSGEDLVSVVRALDAADLRVADLQLHQPSLDDVFLAKTGRKLDVGDRRGAGRARGLMELLQQTYEMARRSVLQTLRQPAMVIPPDPVPADPDGDQRLRAGRGDQHPRLPGRLLPGLRDRVPVHPGLAVRVDQRRQRGRARRRDRLPEPARADADAARGDAARAPQRRAGRRADRVASSTSRSASRPACTSSRASPAWSCCWCWRC